MSRKPRRNGRLAPILAREPAAARASIADIPEATQRAVYQALLEAAAAGQAPEAARYQVARRYAIIILKVEAIEERGLAQGWSVRAEQATPSHRRRP